MITHSIPIPSRTSMGQVPLPHTRPRSPPWFCKLTADRELDPSQVKAIMQINAFPHDLDPYSVNGLANVHGGTVNIAVSSDNDANDGTGANDPNSWTVTYVGPGYVKELHFNPEGLAQNGGNVTGGNFNGFTPMDFLDPTKYHFTPGMVFNVNQYTPGTQSDVTATATFTNAAPLPSPMPSTGR